MSVNPTTIYVVSEHYQYDNSHMVHVKAYSTLEGAVDAINEVQKAECEENFHLGVRKVNAFTPCTVDELEYDDDRWHWFAQENSNDTYFTITRVNFQE